MSKTWLNNLRLSGWSYLYCKFVEDKPEIRKFITTSHYSYLYCRDIEDKPEVRKYITNPRYRYYYLNYIKNKTRTINTRKILYE